MPNLPQGLYQRGSTYWVSYTDTSGQRRLVPVGKDLPRALERHQELRESRPEPAPGVPFESLIEPYLEHHRTYNKPRTLESAEHSLRALLRHFRGKDASQLTEKDLSAFISKRRQRVKDVSVNKDLRTLKALLRHAVSSGTLEKVPIKVTQLRVPRKRITQVLSPEDIQRLLSHAQGRLYGILLVAAATGLRTDEILHLQWRDIRWDMGMIAVTSKEEEGWTTKSHQERSVYVPQKVLDYLKLVRESTRFHRDRDWVFSTRTGNPMNVNNTGRELRKVFKAAGLYVKGQNLIHRIRHSVATELLGQGNDLETVRDWLGHASIGTTALYLHTTDERKKRASQSLKFV